MTTGEGMLQTAMIQFRRAIDVLMRESFDQLLRMAARTDLTKKPLTASGLVGMWKKKTKNPRVGSTLQSLLKEEGIKPKRKRRTKAEMQAARDAMLEQQWPVPERTTLVPERKPGRPRKVQPIESVSFDQLAAIPAIPKRKPGRPRKSTTVMVPVLPVLKEPKQKPPTAANRHKVLCYYPGCQNLAAPRYGMFCTAAHKDISVQKKEEYKRLRLASTPTAAKMVKAK